MRQRETKAHKHRDKRERQEDRETYTQTDIHRDKGKRKTETQRQREKHGDEREPTEGSAERPSSTFCGASAGAGFSAVGEHGPTGPELWGVGGLSERVSSPALPTSPRTPVKTG